MLNTAKLENQEATAFENVELIFQLNMTEAQANAGMLGTVLVFHPAFTTRAKMFQGKDGVIRLSGASIKTQGASPEAQWFNIVTFNAGFRTHVINQYKAEIEGKREMSPWYLKVLGERNIEINDSQRNESLDILDIFINAKLSDKQEEVGMLCKATIKTSIGSVRGITVYKSKFGQAVYAMEQEEVKDIKAYTLTRDGEAQLLNLIHPLVEDWSLPEKKVVKAVATAPVDTEMPPFDASLYE